MDAKDAMTWLYTSKSSIEDQKVSIEMETSEVRIENMDV